MHYAPRHAITRARRTSRWATTGLATAALTLGGGLATAGSAQAADGGVWDRVAACESGGNWSINTGNGYHGGLQFTPSTWRAHGGKGSAAHASKAEQIAVAKRVLATQGPGAWPVCSRKAGLTRGNGGADSSSHATARSSRSTERKAVSTRSAKTTKKVAKRAAEPAKRTQRVATKAQRPTATAAPKASSHKVVAHKVSSHKASSHQSASRAVAAFPGAKVFALGHRDASVTLLGQRLEAHGYGSFYKVGPTSTFTQADKAAVQAFQKAQGWTGADADGIPGPATWARLMAPAR